MNQGMSDLKGMKKCLAFVFLIHLPTLVPPDYKGEMGAKWLATRIESRFSETYPGLLPRVSLSCSQRRLESEKWLVACCPPHSPMAHAQKPENWVFSPRVTAPSCSAKALEGSKPRPSLTAVFLTWLRCPTNSETSCR